MIWFFTIVVGVIVLAYLLGTKQHNEIRKFDIETNQQKGGFRTNYPNLTKLLEDKYKMKLVVDTGDSFEYQIDLTDNESFNGYFRVKLFIDNTNKRVLESTLTTQDGQIVKPISTVIRVTDLEVEEYQEIIDKSIKYIEDNKPKKLIPIKVIIDEIKGIDSSKTITKKRSYLTEEEQKRYDYPYSFIEELPKFDDDELEEYFKILKKRENGEDLEWNKLMELEDKWYFLLSNNDLLDEETHIEIFKIRGANPNKYVNNLIYFKHIEFQENALLFQMSGMKDNYNSSIKLTQSAMAMSDFPRYFTVYQAAAYTEVLSFFYNNPLCMLDLINVFRKESITYFDKKNRINDKGLKYAIDIYLKAMNLPNTHQFECFIED